ncbi:AsnC family protein [Myxococcus fulvus]|uniref:AsnC family protein n=1 Tax=Myxococcus fulvus TaxID=33 RepID=UPI000942791E|nr:AsnC family protein [Myxococcus fulvus]
MPQLDRIDRAILTALQNNARLSNKELAAQVWLAPLVVPDACRRSSPSSSASTWVRPSATSEPPCALCRRRWLATASAAPRTSSSTWCAGTPRTCGG